VPRYSRDGKRLVTRKPRAEVPAEVLASIDMEASKVLKLRGDVDGLRGHARRLGHTAYRVAFAADMATHPGLRKALYDQAAQLERQAGEARVRVSRAERDLAGRMQALRGLHRQARAYQQGQQEHSRAGRSRRTAPTVARPATASRAGHGRDGAGMGLDSSLRAS
jgi:hypothetical protein